MAAAASAGRPLGCRISVTLDASCIISMCLLIIFWRTWLCAGRRHFVPPITGCGRSFDEVVRPILDLSYYIEAKRQSLIYKATLFT